MAHEAGAEIAPVHDVLGGIAASEITATRDGGAGNEVSEVDRQDRGRGCLFFFSSSCSRPEQGGHGPARLSVSPTATRSPSFVTETTR